jgi:hypothetical protein
MNRAAKAHAANWRIHRLTVSAAPVALVVISQLPTPVLEAGKNGMPRSSPLPIVSTNVHGDDVAGAGTEVGTDIAGAGTEVGTDIADAGTEVGTDIADAGTEVGTDIADAGTEVGTDASGGRVIRANAPCMPST